VRCSSGGEAFEGPSAVKGVVVVVIIVKVDVSSWLMF
jgi:hypothetical protein